MKAIEIKSEWKPVFLKAAEACSLEVEELKKLGRPGIVYFRVKKRNFSMNDLFRLGVVYEKFRALL